MPNRDLRILCMPYLGGTTLARLFELLRECPPTRRTGKHLIEALDQAQAQVVVPIGMLVQGQGPYRGTLSRSGYVSAVVWLGACLADGLQYAASSTPTTAASCTWTSSRRTSS
jgi:hypothetical protein